MFFVVAKYRYDTAMEKDMLVDREALHRMVLLRRQFYDRFCRRAIKELDAEVNQVHIDMVHHVIEIHYIRSTFNYLL